MGLNRSYSEQTEIPSLVSRMIGAAVDDLSG